MEEMIKIAGIVLLGVSAAIVVKKTNAEIAYLIAVCTGVCVLFTAVGQVTELYDTYIELMKRSGLDGNLTSTTLRFMLIAIVGQLTAEMCREQGYSGIASAVDFAAAALTVVAAVPVVEEMFSLFEEIL